MEPVEHTAQRATHGSVIQRSTSDERRAGIGDSSSASNSCPPDHSIGGEARTAYGIPFRGRTIHDGTGMIALEVPRLVPRAAKVSIWVRVDWSLVIAKAVARLYLIADANHQPLLAVMSLIPDLVPPHLYVDVRLDGTGEVRAVVECGDGTLLQVKRWVEVTGMPA